VRDVRLPRTARSRSRTRMLERRARHHASGLRRRLFAVFVSRPRELSEVFFEERGGGTRRAAATGKRGEVTSKQLPPS